MSPSESVHTAQAVSLAYVGLGANLGSPVDALRQALVAIRALPDTWLVAVSSPYRTAPLQANGPDFVNAVAELRTRLEPEVLLQHLLTIEQAHGRQRPYRNAPRTLDLDLLLYGDSVLNTESLILPHPRLHQRQFVLIPLLELNPQMHIAGLGAVRELSGALSDQAIERLDESLFP